MELGRVGREVADHHVEDLVERVLGQADQRRLFSDQLAVRDQGEDLAEGEQGNRGPSAGPRPAPPRPGNDLNDSASSMNFATFGTEAKGSYDSRQGLKRIFPRPRAGPGGRETRHHPVPAGAPVRRVRGPD